MTYNSIEETIIINKSIILSPVNEINTHLTIFNEVLTRVQ